DLVQRAPPRPWSALLESECPADPLPNRERRRLLKVGLPAFKLLCKLPGNLTCALGRKAKLEQHLLRFLTQLRLNRPAPGLEKAIEKPPREWPHDLLRDGAAKFV